MSKNNSIVGTFSEYENPAKGVLNQSQAPVQLGDRESCGSLWRLRWTIRNEMHARCVFHIASGFAVHFIKRWSLVASDCRLEVRISKKSNQRNNYGIIDMWCNCGIGGSKAVSLKNCRSKLNEISIMLVLGLLMTSQTVKLRSRANHFPNHSMIWCSLFLRVPLWFLSFLHTYTGPYIATPRNGSTLGVFYGDLNVWESSMQCQWKSVPRFLIKT